MFVMLSYVSFNKCYQKVKTNHYIVIGRLSNGFEFYYFPLSTNQFNK